MPAFSDPSDAEAAIQWPLAHPWPEHRRRRLAVMASGSGSNFEALVHSCRNGRLAASVELLVVNNPAAPALERARRLGIPAQLRDHRRYGSRQELDGALVTLFREQAIDLVVMAGWMRIVTPVLIEAFDGRLINIHPSLLPSFRGLDAVGQALAAGVTLSGCSAHLVNEELDGGEILVQAAVPVLAGDSHARLQARIQRHEHLILPLAVALASQRLDQAADQG
ncbi:MAG: phosphoribosylglycinamide formyltransferase [Prochlorococcaceae cyanobacterium]